MRAVAPNSGSLNDSVSHYLLIFRGGDKHEMLLHVFLPASDMLLRCCGAMIMTCSFHDTYGSRKAKAKKPPGLNKSLGAQVKAKSQTGNTHGKNSLLLEDLCADQVV